MGRAEVRHRITRAARRSPASLALGASASSGCIGYDGDFDRGYQSSTSETIDQIKVGATTKPQALDADGHAFDDFDRRRRRLVLHRPEDASRAGVHARRR